ncbi:MAG: hypothetical protein IKS20_13135 [Victivallales bacterium]|nr:hypothetical protein [Victivallales bacterium]
MNIKRTGITFAAICLCVCQAVRANNFYAIGRTAQAPVIDGQEDACYGEAMSIGGLTYPSRMLYAKEQTFVKFCHDGENLYGLVTCRQKDAAKIAASTPRRDDANLWRSNAVELFFMVDGTMRQFMLDPFGSIFDCYARQNEALEWEMDANWNSAIQVATSRDAQQWRIEFALPFSDLDNARSLKFNIIRDTGKSSSSSSLARLERYDWWRQYEHFSQIELLDEVMHGFDFVELPQMNIDSSCQLTLHNAADAALFHLNAQGSEIKPEIQGRNVNWNYKGDFSDGKTKDVTLSVKKGGKILYSFRYEVPIGRVTIAPANLRNNLIYLDGRLGLDAKLSWNCKHNYPGGQAGNGGKIAKPLSIVFEAPEGVNFKKAKIVKTYAKNGAKYCTWQQDEQFAYNASHWLKSNIGCTLPAGTRGKISYSMKYPEGFQEAQSFDFLVLDIPRTDPPRHFITGHYNSWPRTLKEAREMALAGVNTVPIRGYGERDMNFCKELKKEGFKLRRADYFWPGHSQHGQSGWEIWTKNDRSARAKDIGGFYITSGDSFQISPTYRGKLFSEDIRKEADFCRKAGIDWFSFDMEGYIQRRGEAGDFCERTLEEYKRYFSQKFPNMAFVDPKVFERKPDEYPEYHRIWVDFKCEMWGAFFKDMKEALEKEINKDAPSDAPRRKAIFSEWSMNKIANLEDRNHSLRGASFFREFDYIELDLYSGIDRNLREIEQQIAVFKREFPDVPLNLILTPCPVRLGTSSNNYYYTNAPEIPDERKYMIMESITLGAKGIYTWYAPLINLDYIRQFSQGIQIVNKVEDIVMNGRSFELPCNYPADLKIEDTFKGRKQVLENQKRVFTRGISYKGRTVLSVSEYRNLNDLEVVPKFKAETTMAMVDLDTGENLGLLKAGDKPCIRLSKGGPRCRLLLLSPITAK